MVPSSKEEQVLTTAPCHKHTPAMVLQPWSTLAAVWVQDREQGHAPAGTAGLQGTPGAGRLHRCQGRQAVSRGVPGARPKQAKPAWPASGQSCGCWRFP